MICLFCQSKIKHLPLSIHYDCPKCGKYQLDFGFKSQLDYFKLYYPDRYEDLLTEIKKELLKKGSRKLFLIEDSELVDEDPNLYYLELNDFTRRIGIDMSSNSRGSDYGD